MPGSVRDRARVARRWVRDAVALVLILPIVAGCVIGDDESKPADPRVVGVSASPTALAELPEGIEEGTITIASGRFTVDRLVLQEDEPTQLHVVNDDDAGYRLRIVEDLLTDTRIAPTATTDVSFTTPTAAVYEAQLLAQNGNDVLDTATVAVLAPGGVQP